MTSQNIALNRPQFTRRLQAVQSSSIALPMSGKHEEKNDQMENTLAKTKMPGNMVNHLVNEDWEKVAEHLSKTEFAAHLGIRVILDNPDLPKCEISDIQPFHLGGIGQEFVNGAIISAILDFTLGLTGLKYSKMGNFATRSLNIDIARPIGNDRFYVIAKCNRKIANNVFSEATVFDSNDEPCVYATGMLRVGITKAKTKR